MQHRYSWPGVSNAFMRTGTHLTLVVISMGSTFEFSLVPITKPEEVNFIFGQSHFIKTAEDIAEAVTGSVTDAKFGLAFCEASADCLIRCEGNDDALVALAQENASKIAAGHSRNYGIFRLMRKKLS